MRNQSPEKHCNDIVTKFAVSIKESQKRLPTFDWLPKLHKRPYNIVLSQIQLLVCIKYCLTAIKKNHWIKYCEKKKTYEREGINDFWSIRNSTEILN